MSSSEVSKFAVYDPRVVQSKPKYAVQKGAVSLTNGKFSAIANSASMQSFNIMAPSENVFVDRAVMWTNTAVVQLAVTTTGTLAVAQPCLLPGRDIALAPFPIHQAISTLSVTINDATITTNMSDVLPQVLRMADMEDSRRQRTCPTMLDRYAIQPDTAAVTNSPLSGYERAHNSDEVPNGAWGQFSFCTSTGAALTEGAVYTAGVVSADVGVGRYTITNGTPCVTTASAANGFTLFIKFTTTEKLVSAPFIFQDDTELSTGLFGVQGIQVLANFNAPTRSIRCAPSSAAVAGITRAVVPTWATGVTGGSPFITPVINMQFLTPPLDLALPPKSIVPFIEYPRYISSVYSQDIAAYGTAQLQSQTITLPSIPDLLLVYVKPQSYANTTQGDWVLPITGVSVNFDNFSGLLASHTQEQLYGMSIHNGLDMDYNEWTGKAIYMTTSSAVGYLPLVGGALVLRPGRDFALQTGQAAGLVGNFSLQLNVSVQNNLGVSLLSAAPNGVNIYVVAINSGFFETIKGQSRVIKGVLTEQDVMSSPATASTPELERLVGEGRRKKKGAMSKYV